MKCQPTVITAKALCSWFGCYSGVVGTVPNVLPTPSSFNSPTCFVRCRFNYNPDLYSFPRAAVRKYLRVGSLNNRNVLSQFWRPGAWDLVVVRVGSF